ncbi:hypothetical protein BX600DRAFT_472264 [Xylariales sp. PMI_506]|nr:hypothetical protein BX600DRAFT_472264 [Xylariales sp. PMI_506]
MKWASLFTSFRKLVPFFFCFFFFCCSFCTESLVAPTPSLVGTQKHSWNCGTLITDMDWCCTSGGRVHGEAVWDGIGPPTHTLTPPSLAVRQPPSGLQ